MTNVNNTKETQKTLQVSLQQTFKNKVKDVVEFQLSKVLSDSMIVLCVQRSKYVLNFLIDNFCQNSSVCLPHYRQIIIRFPYYLQS